MQQQLHASGLNERIEIGPYLTKLCASLAASMIGERRALSIKVQATSGRAVSSEAVSLGLIVTELVINALKHGFPAGAEGEILVSYDAQDSGWRLSVSDNGSGTQGSGRRARTYRPWHEHRRGAGASTRGHGREDEWTGGHRGDDHCTRNQRRHSGLVWLKLMQTSS